MRRARTPPLTRSGQALAAAALTLGLLGIALGNFQLLLLAVAPVALLAHALAAPHPRAPGVERHVSTLRPQRGDRVHVRLTVDAPEGSHAVEVHQPLPEGILLEEGTNVLLAPPGGRTETRFVLRTPKRGRFELPPVAWERVHLPGLLGPVRERAGDPVELQVRPRFRAPHGVGARIPSSATRATPLASGPRTTEFADLREYAWGDAMRHINWKASARRLSTGAGTRPLVNEYEHEARGRLVILLDAGPALDVGSDLETGLDHALEAAYALAAHHLSQGLRVGFHAYRAGPGVDPVLPDAGQDQLRRIRDVLARVEAGTRGGLLEAVRTLQGHLREGSRVLVLTRIAPPADDLRAGLHALRRLVRRDGAVTVLDVQALHLVEARDPYVEAAHLARQRASATLAHALREETGARVVSWNPRTPFTPAILRPNARPPRRP